MTSAYKGQNASQSGRDVEHQSGAGDAGGDYNERDSRRDEGTGGGEEQHAQPPLKDVPQTPLPWRQITVLLLMRLAEPISFSFIFPFIGDMLWELKATDDPSKIGSYAGIIESLFAAVQTLTVLQWARASDKYGRKPIILNGLLGSSVSSLLFGFSTTFPLLVAARCLSGAVNGNVAIYKALMSEITDRTNAARAFSLLPLMWALGCTIGPLLGGYLSQPAKKYPWLFAKEEGGALALNGLFEEYPFALPCMASAAITWLSIILGALLLEETLPSKVAKRREKEAQTKQAKSTQAGPDGGERAPLLGGPDRAHSYGAPTQKTGVPGSSSQHGENSASNPSNVREIESLRSTLHRTLSKGSLRRDDETLLQGANATSSTSDGGAGGDPPGHQQPQRQPSFARLHRPRMRLAFGSVQSFYSGFTPTGSGHATPERQQSQSRLSRPRRTISQTQRFETDDASWQNGHEEGRRREGDETPPKDDDDKTELSVMDLLRNSHIRRIMLSYAFLSLTSVAFDSVQVLYFWEPISLGGLSFPSTITGTVLSSAGLFGVGIQLGVFPPLQKRLGTLRLYKLALSAFLFVPTLLPLANIAARRGLLVKPGEEHEGGFQRDVGDAAKAAVFLLVGVSMSMKSVASMAFSCNIILVKQARALAPGAPMGTLNGLAQMSSSVMRAVGPLGASMLFSETLERQLLGGYLVWLVLLCVALGASLVTAGVADVEKMIDRGEISEEAANPRG